MILHKSRNKINIMTWCLSFDYCFELNQPALVLSVQSGMSRLPTQMFTVHTLHCCTHPLQLLQLSWASPFYKFNRPKCCFPMGVLSECYVSGHEKYCFIKNFIGILARKSLNTTDLKLNIGNLLNAFWATTQPQPSKGMHGKQANLDYSLFQMLI